MKFIYKINVGDDVLVINAWGLLNFKDTKCIYKVKEVFEQHSYCELVHPNNKIYIARISDVIPIKFINIDFI